MEKLVRYFNLGNEEDVLKGEVKAVNLRASPGWTVIQSHNTYALLKKAGYNHLVISQGESTDFVVTPVTCVSKDWQCLGTIVVQEGRFLLYPLNVDQ